MVSERIAACRGRMTETGALALAQSLQQRVTGSQPVAGSLPKSALPALEDFSLP